MLADSCDITQVQTGFISRRTPPRFHPAANVSHKPADGFQPIILGIKRKKRLFYLQTLS
jgi:hypothetical protein